MPRPPKREPTTRLTLDLSEPVRAKLDALKERTEADSLVEVVRRALAVYSYLWDEKTKGREVLIRGVGTDRELVLV